MTYDQLRVDLSDRATTRRRIPARRSWGKLDQTSVTASIVSPQIRAQGFLDQLRQCRLPLQRRDRSAQLERRVYVKSDAAASTTRGPTHAVSLSPFPGIRDLRKSVSSTHCHVYVYPGIIT